MCGASFKNKTLYDNHQKKEHLKKKIYTCSACREQFSFRYLLMDHIANIHKRTIVDNETNFYKCFVCQKGFSSQHRKAFVQHLNDHRASSSFCSDCNVNLESIHHLEAHRERSHQDFSILVDKKPVRNTKSIAKEVIHPTPPPVKKPQAAPVKVLYQEVQEELHLDENEQFNSADDDAQQQQIMVQTEDGSLLNMNNFILTENGELIIQNLEGLLPNGQESVVDESSSGQIHISNLEQFLMEQGLTGSTEISYIQPDEGQVIIHNDDGTVSQSSQESLMQTYKEIFDPDESIPTELIASTEVPEMNGDYIAQSMASLEQHSSNGQIAEQVEVQNNAQTDANQSTLDELGDILLEVAAAAEKEKKPKVIEQKIIRDSLWGRKRTSDQATTNNGPSKKKPNTAPARQPETSFKEAEIPARDFSQAYEFFVKGFDAKKQKNL